MQTAICEWVLMPQGKDLVVDKKVLQKSASDTDNDSYPSNR